MFQTSELVPLLTARGIHMSREQVYLLVTKTPQRLNIEVLAALCDGLDCQPNDLLTAVVAAGTTGQGRRRRQQWSQGRVAAPDPRLGAHPLRRAVSPALIECARRTQHAKPRGWLFGDRVCGACHMRIRRDPQPCHGCGLTKVIAFLDHESQRRCAPCAGQPAQYACKECGSAEQIYGRCCGPCTLRRRATILLTDPDGRIHRQLVPVFDALVNVDRAQTTLWWFHHSKGGPELLRRMAQGEVAITHEAFADLPADRPTNYKLTRGSMQNGHSAINTITRFLGWLPANDLALATLIQGDLDRYLVGHPRCMRYVADFLTWTQHTDLTTGLTTPAPRRPRPEVTSPMRTAGPTSSYCFTMTASGSTPASLVS